jgi:hypothetical protein
MDPIRITQQLVSALQDLVTNRRVAQESVEIAGDAPIGGNARISQQAIEVLADPIGIFTANVTDSLSLSHQARLTTVIVNGVHSLSVTHQATQNLVREASASSNISLTDIAEGGRILSGDVTDTLTLAHVATVTAVKVIVDTLSLSDLASGEIIKLANHTLVITHEATVSNVFERLAVDTLTPVDEAITAYAKRLNAISSLEIVDVASGECIKPISHTLTISHTAQLELVRRSSDTISLNDTASVVTVYARSVTEETVSLGHQAAFLGEFGRVTSDTLTLNELVAGDHCRVVTSVLTLDDIASVDLVRLASDTLSLSQTVESNWILTRRRAELLNVTHSAIATLVHTYVADSTIVLTQQAVVSVAKVVADTLTLMQVATVDNVRQASDELTITQVASASNTRLAAYDDLIGLNHVAIVGFVKQVSAASTLNIREKARSGIEIGVASDQLQELHYNYDPVTGELTPYYIGLQDRADVAVIRYAPYPAIDIVSLSDKSLGVLLHADAKPGDGSDTLNLSHTAVGEQWPFFRGGQQAANNLIVTQTADVLLVRLASHTLALTQSAVVAIVHATLPIVDTLQFRHSVGFVLISADATHQYHPFIGEGDGLTPSANCPTPVAGIGACRLCYPVSHPTESIILRSPEFSNRDRLQMNRISRETRGGTLIVFADAIWPKIQTLALTFSGLTRTQAQEYLLFVKEHLGLEVGFVDWEGFYWKGVIMNPSEPAVQDSKSIFTVSFEFECETATWEP